ncbi:MAG: AraC family transcriptional regulator [Eubacterium sp.]|nr:AraC family transcriptional regulator [Eubacterium sp.]
MPVEKRKKTHDITRITVMRGKRGDFSPKQPDHSHNHYEIFFLLSGKCRFLLKDTVYYLEKGDLVFIVPEELHHAVYSTDGDCEILMIYFKKEHLNWDLFAPYSSQEKMHSFMGSIPALYQEDFVSLLTRMQAESAGIDKYSTSFLRCCLHEILLMLMRYSVMNEEEPQLLNSRDADILLATRYIYQNYRNPLTLEEVSAQAALSPTYFSKKFKQVTGMGFKEYLNYVRLKHARTALLTTGNTITDIALENGFNDSNYFKDLFKKIYGKSPREFRKHPE